MSELMIHNVKEKLEKEMPSQVGGSRAPEMLIAKEVKNALINFCEQEGKLAEAIIKSTKTFKECLKSIVADTKSRQYISDIDAYRRAVIFYLPEAEIECKMTVKAKNSTEDLFSLSLEDLV